MQVLDTPADYGTQNTRYVRFLEKFPANSLLAGNFSQTEAPDAAIRDQATIGAKKCLRHASLDAAYVRNPRELRGEITLI